MLLSYIILFLISGLLLLLLPIKVRITYLKNNKQNKLKLQVKILFLTINKDISRPLIKVLSLMSKQNLTQDSIKESLQTRKLPRKNWGLVFYRFHIWMPRLIQISAHAFKLTSKILKPIKCKKLNLYNEIGLCDAAQTGLAIGGMWAIFSTILSQLSKWMILEPQTPQIEIIPDFNKIKLHIEYDCIIVFPLGHIIIVIIQMARFLRISKNLINNSISKEIILEGVN